MKKFEELSMQEMKEIYEDYINLKSTFAASKKSRVRTFRE